MDFEIMFGLTVETVLLAGLALLVYLLISLGSNFFMEYFYDSRRLEFLLFPLNCAIKLKDWMWTTLTHPFRTRDRRLFKERFGFRYDDNEIDYHTKSLEVAKILNELGYECSRLRISYPRSFARHLSYKNAYRTLKQAYKLAQMYSSVPVKESLESYIK